MEDAFSDIMHILKKPSVTEAVVNILVCAVPIWLAVVVGLLIGWAWRPRWTGLVFFGLRSRFRFLWTVPPGFGARRLWLAFTALSIFSVGRTLWCSFKRNRGKLDVPVVWTSPVKFAVESTDSSRWQNEVGEEGEEEVVEDVVTERDLERLLGFLDVRNRLIEWQCMMKRSTSNMAYQAWLHEPQAGPTVYCSRTVFEDASPELVRDFFWDDEFRPKWDPMLVYFKTLAQSPRTGTMIVHWIKKFPFFCSDREYVIGRRIWEGRIRKAYYCVTKAVPFGGLAERDKPRRVDLFFSSWVVKRVESRRGDGCMTACEVTLVHYEDMMIPRDVAKLGVRHGMWGAVKKLHSGMRVYQNARRCKAEPLSRSALMAKITTAISLQEAIDSSSELIVEENTDTVNCRRQLDDHQAATDWRWVIIGGSMAAICGFHSAALFVAAGQRILQLRHRQR